jgi:hypothetical protein
MNATLDTEPYFDAESQEVRTEGERVYLIEDTTVAHEGSEGVYLGRSGHGALVGLDTPSGEPYKVTLPFASLRSLYR